MGRLRLVAASVLATALTACGAAPPSTSVTATSTDLPGVPNFHEVNGKLFRSGHVDFDRFGAVKAQGVKTVLSLEDHFFDRDRAQEEVAAAEGAGLQDIWEPMSGIDKPTVEQVKKALAAIDDPSLQPLLVHCQHGSDRTGIVIAAYRMTHEGWSKDQAVAEMRTYGHSVFLRWWDDVLDNFR